MFCAEGFLLSKHRTKYIITPIEQITSCIKHVQGLSTVQKCPAIPPQSFPPRITVFSILWMKTILVQSTLHTTFPYDFFFVYFHLDSILPLFWGSTYCRPTAMPVETPCRFHSRASHSIMFLHFLCCECPRRSSSVVVS